QGSVQQVQDGVGLCNHSRVASTPPPSNKRALMRLRHVLLSAGFAVLPLSAPAQAQKAQVEAPTAKLAAQVRIHGFVCDKALGATRDKKRSKPDYAVWVLKGSNAVYRVSRAPDLLAKVQPLQR